MYRNACSLFADQPDGPDDNPILRLSTIAVTRRDFSVDVNSVNPGLYMVVSSSAMAMPSPSLTPS
jgi:hypothetical protein